LLYCFYHAAKQSDLFEIPIDIRQNNSLSLYEIAEEITANSSKLSARNDEQKAASLRKRSLNQSREFLSVCV
jgi:hypothetical protein